MKWLMRMFRNIWNCLTQPAQTAASIINMPTGRTTADPLIVAPPKRRGKDTRNQSAMFRNRRSRNRAARVVAYASKRRNAV